MLRSSWGYRSYLRCATHLTGWGDITGVEGIRAYGLHFFCTHFGSHFIWLTFVQELSSFSEGPPMAVGSEQA